MKNRRFAEIPEALREGWEPTEGGKAWVELLGPHVPEDVKRWTPNTDSGFLLSDPHALLAADNSFAAALEGAQSIEPALQMLTSTYFFHEVPHEGDCLMFHCFRGSETADVVVWSHETGEFYGPVAYDLPTMTRIIEVAGASDDEDARRAALAPALGRWAFDVFPMSLFEDALEDDDIFSRDDDWPAVEPPKSVFERLVKRAWWVAGALVNAAPDTDHIKAQLDATPDKAFAADDFQDLPYSALYWLWRTYFLGEDAWHQTALARCKDSRSRLVRDAAAYVEAEGGTGKLAAWRKNAIEFVAQARNPFPDRVEIGPVAFVRDDSLANLEPPADAPPEFKVAPGQPGSPHWPAEARVAARHPDRKRWLVEGQREHPRRGKHPSIPGHIAGLFEVDPETGVGTLFCDTAGESHVTRWAEYLDEDTVLVINNGRLRLYERIPRVTGRGYLVDEMPLHQERAAVLRGLHFIAGYGGVSRWNGQAQVTVAERISCARLVDRRLKPTAVVELALAYVTEKDGHMVGRSADETAGYRVEGLTATAQPGKLVLAPSRFKVPEKVWRAGPNPVLDALGPMDVSVESSAGLCLINKLVTDPPNTRRAYVGNADGIRPTEPELDMVGYALITPTQGLVTTATEAYAADLDTGAAELLFAFPEGSSVEVLDGGYAILSGDQLVLRDTAGEQFGEVNVGEGAAILAPLHGGLALAMKTASSPLVVLALDGGELRLLGAVRPDGDLAGISFEFHQLPQQYYRLLAKLPDGTRLDLRGLDAVLLDRAVGARVDGALPERPWEVAPEITRG